MQRKGKIIAGLVIAAIVALGIGFAFRYYFVFGAGTKAGTLNQFVYKGVIWKTYEGRIIMEGYRQGMQSNYFEFSVTDQAIADSLMKCSGKYVNLQYQEYFAPLPWRGHQKYVVNKILEVK